MAPDLWHVALTSSVEAIMEGGLKPRSAHDVRRYECGADDEAVYLHAREADARERLENRCDLVMVDGKITGMCYDQTLLRIDGSAVNVSSLVIDHEDLAFICLTGRGGAEIEPAPADLVIALRAHPVIAASMECAHDADAFTALGLAASEAARELGLDDQLRAYAMDQNLALMHRGPIDPSALTIIDQLPRIACEQSFKFSAC